MRETVTHGQRLSITLRYLAAVNNFEDLKFDLQAVTECLQTVRYIAQLFNIIC